MKNFPSKSEILDWIKENPDQASKREIARAFGIKGDDRTTLKRLLKEMRQSGEIEGSRKRFHKSGALPPVTVLAVDSIDRSGDIWLTPLEWEGEGAPPKTIFIPKKTDPALGKGDRILGRLSQVDLDDYTYEARLIRLLASSANKLVGIYRDGSEGGRLVPIDKKESKEWRISEKDSNGAKDGELVEAEQVSPKDRMGLPSARVTERLGDPSAPRAISLIAIHQHEIPNFFDDEVLEEAERAQPVELGSRTDLRELPLFTIDPSDARDHDDAICAILDKDPKNEGGFIVWVAIADVAYYVRPGSALDLEAKNRGNSSYFPDRVVPMLPDALSGDLCSLHEGVDRACMAVRIVMDGKGQKISHEFHRAIMRSPASLSYEQAQATREGIYDEATQPLKEPLEDLFNAYFAAQKARNERQPLNLDLPERKIVLSSEGEVLSVDYAERFDAHRLVEEFMVMANVCAAETLEKFQKRLLYRVHEEPSPEKLEKLIDVAKEAGLALSKGMVLKTSHLNKLLKKAEESENAELINMTVLRSMTQAYYSPENFGHFGLNLKRYAHFTSPIRRYADLIVHRALISAHGFGDDGLSETDISDLKETGEWISQTERRSMLAERDTKDRYLASYLQDRVGAEFKGRVSGIARFGLFVRLDETGADGIVPLQNLGNEYWSYREKDGSLKGDRTGRVISIGQECVVTLVDATAVTGGLTLGMISLEGEELKSTQRGRGRTGRKISRKSSKSRRQKRK